MMDRKAFIKKLGIGILFGIPFYSMIGCSKEEGLTMAIPSDTTDDSCIQNGTISTISTNHGHDLVVSKADVENGTEKQYAIQGTSDHTHSVTITSSNFASLKKGQSISVTSTLGDGHTHNVSVSCA